MCADVCAPTLLRLPWPWARRSTNALEGKSIPPRQAFERPTAASMECNVFAAMATWCTPAGAQPANARESRWQPGLPAFRADAEVTRENGLAAALLCAPFVQVLRAEFAMFYCPAAHAASRTHA